MQKYRNLILATLSLGAFPTLIYGGWASDIFGLGQAAGMVAGAAVWLKLIGAVQGALPVIVFMLMALLATVQLFVAYRVNADFSESFRTAAKNDEITRKEMLFLIWQLGFTVVLVVTLALSALFEIYVMWSGVTDLMAFKAP